MVSFDHFQQELRQRMRRAAASGSKHVEISAEELHKGVRGHPASRPSALLCCDVMQQEMRPGDQIIDDVRLKSGALIVRYALPR